MDGQSEKTSFPYTLSNTLSAPQSVFGIRLGSALVDLSLKSSLVPRSSCQAAGLPITTPNECTARRHSVAHVMLIIRDSLWQKTLLGFDTTPVGGLNKSSGHA